MIIVTGATGQLGSRITDQLLERVPADQIGVSVREPAKAEGLVARGVRVRAGDFTDPDSLPYAFEGATRVLVVSAGVTGSDAVQAHVDAIDAAVAAGARRVVYTSHQAAGAESRFAPMLDHAATEAYLTKTGAPFTSLRNGFYASTVPYLLGPALQTGELVAPADGPVSWTSHGDLAAAAAAVLSQDELFDGPTPALTGSAAIDLVQIAALLSELTGRPIRRVVADDDDWLAGLIAHGVPEARGRTLLGMFRASREGEFATVDPTLASLLGREPESVRLVLERVVQDA